MAASDISTALDLPLTGAYRMSAEDKAAVAQLYQKCPALWTVFAEIADCVDALGDPSVLPETLYGKLATLCRPLEQHEARDGKILDICRFAVAAGFVDQAVAWYRQTLREMGKAYVTMFNQPHRGCRDGCLNVIRSHFLNCSLYSVDFSRRLIAAGFVSDMVEDLTHATHLSGDALEKGFVILYSMGTLDNFCQHTETEALVKQMRLAHIITPFLQKNNEVVKSISIAVLSHVVMDDQLDLMRMDPGLVQYFMGHIEEAVKNRKRNTRFWKTEAVLSTLALLSRCDFNKRLLVAYEGMSETLMSVLDPKAARDEVDKQCTIKIFLELSKDRHNLQLFTKDKRLRQLLTNLKGSSDLTTRDLATKLAELAAAHDEDDFTLSLDTPNMAALLTDQHNLLSITDVSPVKFALDQLTNPKPLGAGPGDRKVCVLRALAELAQKGEHYNREVMATGGLSKLMSFLLTGNDEERLASLHVIMKLTSNEENRVILKNTIWLTEVLQSVARKVDGAAENSQLASKVLSSIKYQPKHQCNADGPL